MSKAKTPQSPTTNTIGHKAWTLGFELASDVVSETSSQLDALISFLAGLGASGVKLVSKSNTQIASLVRDGLTAAETRGPSLTSAAREKALQLVSGTRETAREAANRATESAKTLIGPAKKAA